MTDDSQAKSIDPPLPTNEDISIIDERSGSTSSSFSSNLDSILDNPGRSSILSSLLSSSSNKSLDDLKRSASFDNGDSLSTCFTNQATKSEADSYIENLLNKAQSTVASSSGTTTAASAASSLQPNQQKDDLGLDLKSFLNNLDTAPSSSPRWSTNDSSGNRTPSNFPQNYYSNPNFTSSSQIGSNQFNNSYQNNVSFGQPPQYNYSLPQTFSGQQPSYGELYSNLFSDQRSSTGQYSSYDQR